MSRDRIGAFLKLKYTYSFPIIKPCIFKNPIEMMMDASTAGAAAIPQRGLGTRWGQQRRRIASA